MADVKWSNNTSFPIQIGFGTGDYIMGLTAGNLNAKYPVSLITSKISGPASATDNAVMIYNGATGKIAKNSLVTIGSDGTITTPTSINLAAYTPTEFFVATAGLNTNNGQVIQPVSSVVYADAHATIGSSVFVATGAYSEGVFLKKVGVGLYGSSPDDCIITSSGLIGIDNTQWIAATSPSFAIHNITLNGNSTSYNSSQYVNNSTQTFSNVNFPSNQFVGGRLTNLNIINGCYLSSASIQACQNLLMSNGICNGNLIITSYDNFNSNVIIKDFDFKGASITFDTGDIGNGSYSIEITNCLNIAEIIYTDNSVGISSSISIDVNSYPNLNIQDLSGGLLTINKITNIANGIDTGNGFSVTSNFSWTGTNGTFPGSNYTLLAGQGAHLTGGSNNILLGNFATSSFSGCFCWSDGTATDSVNHFPSANNQAIFWAAGGFGISTTTNPLDPHQGPQAGFHYGHNYGNDGNFLFSALGFVPDANMHNSELNPYISTDQLIIKQKGSTGTISQYTFPSLGGTIPSKEGSNTWSGTNTFGNGQLTTVDHMLLGWQQNPLASNMTLSSYNSTSTIANFDFISGSIISNPVAPITLTVPQASDIDLILGSVPIHIGFEVLIVNQSANAITLATNTNVNFSACYLTGGSVVIPALSSRLFRVVHSAISPSTYIMAG